MEMSNCEWQILHTFNQKHARVPTQYLDEANSDVIFRSEVSILSKHIIEIATIQVLNYLNLEFRLIGLSNLGNSKISSVSREMDGKESRNTNSMSHVNN